MTKAVAVLVALAASACSRSESQPVPVEVNPVTSTASAGASASAEAPSGTCELGYKCSEWTGNVSAKKLACTTIIGKWSTEPCAMKVDAVGECVVREADVQGTVYYSREAAKFTDGTRTVAQQDCSAMKGGVYRARSTADAGGPKRP